MSLPSLLKAPRGLPLHASCRAFSEALDPVQEAFLAERCILVDAQDRPVGNASKRECHTWTNIARGGMLHRAFSVFLFDPAGRLLLQQRAPQKITFPGLWTNSCCSHPLDWPAERAEEPFGIGVLRAAQRKLGHELGIPVDQVPPESMTILSRILYRAPSACGKWGEHELDYLLALQADVPLSPNPNEVQAVRFVDEAELGRLMADPEAPFTPWFRLAVDAGFVRRMWQNLGRLSRIQDYDMILDKIP